MIRAIVTVACLGLATAACGTTERDRAITAGGMGAIGGGVVGGPVGALVGGAAGAAVGVLTEPDQVNLGPPIWEAFGR